MLFPRRRKHRESSSSPRETTSNKSLLPSRRTFHQRDAHRATATTTRTKTIILLWIVICFALIVTSIISYWSNRRFKSKYQSDFSSPIEKAPTIKSIKGIISAGAVGGNGNGPIVTTRAPVVVSSNMTVVGMGGGYDIQTYRRFVGSLRSTGYDGHILLGVTSSIYHNHNRNRNHDGVQTNGTNGDDGEEDFNVIRNYLVYQGVQMFEMSLIDCGYDYNTNTDSEQFGDVDANSGSAKIPIVGNHQSSSSNHRCLDPYTKLKLGWSSYPLARDWLAKCSPCTGPTLLTSISNVIFQQNPFLPTMPQQQQQQQQQKKAQSQSKTQRSISNKIEGLHLYEEHPSLTTENWRVAMPLRRCKSFLWDVPLLSSDIILGEYRAVISFIEVVVEEMELWMEMPKCVAGGGGGDGMALVNYLFYDGRLGRQKLDASRSSGITVHRHRMGLVHSVVDAAVDPSKELHVTISGGDGTNDGTDWLSSSSEYHQLTDADGYLLNIDGHQSAIVRGIHQLGIPFMTWLDQKLFMKMTIPVMVTVMEEGGRNNDGNRGVRLGLSSKSDTVTSGNQDMLSSTEFHESMSSSSSLLKRAVMEDFTDVNRKALQDWVAQHGADELETYYFVYYKSEEEKSEEEKLEEKKLEEEKSEEETSVED